VPENKLEMYLGCTGSSWNAGCWNMCVMLRNTTTARSREDETRNSQRNANRNPEWWGDFSPLFKSNSSVSRGTSSNWDFDSIEFLCISRYKFKFGFWFHLNLQLTKISPPFRISICVSLTIWCLVFSGTGWAVLRNRKRERWGAGVEYHFQEIEWALRPVVNGT